MIQFYKEYNQELTIWQQPVAKLEISNLALPVKQLSWSHNVILMQKVKDLKARYWYMIQCLKNGWGRNFLVEAINKTITMFMEHWQIISMPPFPKYKPSK